MSEVERPLHRLVDQCCEAIAKGDATEAVGQILKRAIDDALDALGRERDGWKAKAQMFREYADSADRGEARANAALAAHSDAAGQGNRS